MNHEGYPLKNPLIVEFGIYVRLPHDDTQEYFIPPTMFR